MTHTGGWKPTASVEAIRERARQLAYLRSFFDSRGVLEVETPVLGRHGVTDLNLDSICANFEPVAGCPDRTGWLQTSPEYHMKRLLAAGSGPIYQIFRAFRSGERGARHNPEFSLLEWYRPGFSDTELMAEVAELVCGWLQCESPQTLTYQEAMGRFAGIDPFVESDEGLQSRCERWLGAGNASDLGRDGWLDVLMSHEVEVALRDQPPTFITAYPASQAALARISMRDGIPLAHRFELYVAGIELCNGYWELTDAAEQRHRFEADNCARQQAGKPEMPVDEALLSALSAGLPACAGVALGLDRLLMLRLGASSIAEVLAFPLEIA